MSSVHHHKRTSIGVLAGWQFYRTATNLSYLTPVYRGISKATRDLGCNLLLGCGMGPSASPTDPIKPAWPALSTNQDYVPIDHWNSNGLIVAVPLHSQSRLQTATYRHAFNFQPGKVYGRLSGHLEVPATGPVVAKSKLWSMLANRIGPVW